MASGEVASAYLTVSPKVDKGFKKTVEGAMPDGAGMGGKVGKAFAKGFKAPLSGLSSWFKGGAVMGAVSSVTTAAMGAISASMDSAIARTDILANFPKVMEASGYSAEQAAKSTDLMKAAVDGLPTRLQDMASNVRMLTATMGNLSDGEVNATTVGKAFNDMMLAGGQGTDMANNAFTQYTQMLAVGKVDQQAWNSVVMAAPNQLNSVAKSLLGAAAGQRDLYEALKSGKVSFDQFNEAIVRLDNEGGDGFASFSEQARSATTGIDTSMKNAKNAVSNQMANILTELNKNGEIAGIFDGIKAAINSGGKFIVDSIQTVKDTIDFDGFNTAFQSIGATVGAAFGDGGVSAQDFGSVAGNAINSLIPVLNGAEPIIGAIAQGVSFLADNAEVAAPVIVAVAFGLLTIKGVGAAAGMISTVGGALTTIGIGGTSAAGGLAATGTASATASPSLLQVGAAALMVGGGIALAAAGIWLLANAAIQIAGAGPMAAVALVGLVGGIALLAGGAALVGPALTDAAPGVIAFGAAVLMVGAGIGIAAAGLALLAGQMPVIAEYGAAAGASSVVLGGGLLVMGAGALVAGAGMLVLGAGLAVCAPLVLIIGAGAMLLGAGMMMVGMGSVMAAAGMAVMAAALPAIADYAAPAAAGLGALSLAALAAVPGFLSGAGPAAALAAAVVPMGAASTAAALGLTMVCTALPLIAALSVPASTGMERVAEAAGEAAPQVSAAAPAFATFAQSAAMMASGLLASAASVRGVADGAQSAGAGMTALQASMASTAAAGQTAFAAVPAAIGGAFSKAAQMAVVAVQAINAAIGSIPDKTVRINVEQGDVKLPHFSMSGSFNAETGSVPSVDVQWFKTGAIFSKPTIFPQLGMGVGEAGAEALVPLTRPNILPFARAVADEVHGTGGTTNVYEINGMAVDGTSKLAALMEDTAREAITRGRA